MVSKRHIIIDGWNVVRSTPDMERIFLKRGLDAAREELWRIVGPMHDYGGTRITIVYDGSGSDISVVRRNSIDTLAEVFTPSHMTADELIEQLCATSRNPGSIIVVSRDNLLRLTATTFGATALSPDKLFESAADSAKALSKSLQDSNSRAEHEWKSCGAFSALDPFELQIRDAVRRAEIISKHMKKRRKRLASIIEKADSKKTGESVKEVFSSSLPKKNKFKTQLKSFDSLQIPQKKKNFKEPKLADENDVANVPFSELLRRATSGKSYTENGKLFENSKKSRKRNRG